jgi:hypothetical protein
MEVMTYSFSVVRAADKCINKSREKDESKNENISGGCFRFTGVFFRGDVISTAPLISLHGKKVS